MNYQIMVIEDHPAIRTIYREMIARTSNLQVGAEASTAAEALASLAEQCPDLILLDIVLPDKSGLELLRQIKELYPQLPVLVVSGEDPHVYEPVSLRVGASGYIDKIDVGELLIATILEQLGEVKDASSDQILSSR